jgi:hypothetical protein
LQIQRKGKFKTVCQWFFTFSNIIHSLLEKSLKNFICENESVKISQIELIYEKGLIRVSLNFFSENSIIPDKKINGYVTASGDIIKHLDF